MSLKLKEARENAGYSIEEVSKKLNIRKQYLIDLEEENYEGIPGQVYVNGYTKLYENFLGINIDDNCKHRDSVVVKDSKQHKKRINIKNNKILIVVSLTVLILISVGYSYVKQLTNEDQHIRTFL